MSAYFEKGIDLTKTENLTSIAVEHGLDAHETNSFLKSEELASEVKIEEQLNYQRGITGVPFYIINDKYGISGAQPAVVFVNALTEIGNEPESGETCEIGEDKNC